MRYGKQLGVLAALGALSLGGLAVGGGVGPLNPQGRPTRLQEGKANVYAVWHDGNGWHLRTTTKRKEHYFRGTIHVEGGTFTRVHSRGLEKKGGLHDHWRIGPKRQTITFDFQTNKGIDGIDFNVSKGADRVRFHLHIDGKDLPTHTLVGASNQHPQQMPFSLPAHPLQKKKKSKG